MLMRDLYRRLLSLLLAFGLLLPILGSDVQAEELLGHYRDVPETSWFYSDVRACYEQGLMDGTSADTFSPKDSLTRGMIVTVLGRAARVDMSVYDGQTGFEDVPASRYYAPYIQWALQTGVSEGVTETTFEPDRAVKRMEAAVMLYRFAQSVAIAPETEQTHTYTDEDDIPSWAWQAVQGVFFLGLMEGNENGAFLPRKELTRAEAAAIFVRLNRLLYGDNVEIVNNWFDRQPDPTPAPSNPPVDSDPIPTVSNPIVSRSHLREVMNAHGVKNYSAAYYALISINTVYASRLNSTQRSRPMLFLFEGCGSSSSASLRLNALAVVVKNGKIIYYNTNSTTIPDYPFSPAKNDGAAMPTVCSGIYTVTSVNHDNANGAYAALQVQNAKVVRFSSKSSYYSSTSSGIHIHRRYTDTIPPYSYSWVNSCGCLLIGKAGTSSTGEYARFLQAFGLIPSGYAGNSKYRYYVTGTLVVDRRQAKSYLKAVGYPDKAITMIGLNAVSGQQTEIMRAEAGEDYDQ